MRGSSPAAAIQLRSLVRLSLGQAYRKGISPLNGATIHPLRSTILNIGLLGVFAMLGSLRRADERELWTIVFGQALLISLFGITPETPEGRERSADVVGSRPLSGAIRLGAFAITLGLGSALLGVIFGAASAVGSVVSLHYSPWRALGQLVLLGVQGACVGVAWLHLTAAIIRRFGAERLRRLNMGLIAVLAIVITISGTAHGALHDVFLSAPAPIAILFDSFWHVLPSSWFAAFLLPAEGWQDHVQRAGVLIVVASAVGLGFMGDLDRRQRRLSDAHAEADERASASPPKPRRSVTAWIVRRMGVLLTPGARTVAEILVVHGEREDLNRLRRLLNVVLSLVFFAIGATRRDAGIVHVLGYFTSLALLDGLVVIQQCREPEGAWIFPASPLPRRDLVAGMQATIIARVLIVPVLPLVALVALTESPAAAAVTAIAVLIGVRGASAALLAMRPRLPLSRRDPALQGVAGFGLAMLLALVGSLAGALLLSASRGGAMGLVVVVAVLAAMVAATIGLERLATRRLEAAEAADAA